jgi:hypothetical protein
MAEDQLSLGGRSPVRVRRACREPVPEHVARRAEQDDGVEPVVEPPLVRVRRTGRKG